MSKVKNFHTAQQIATRWGIPIADAEEIVRQKNICRMSLKKPSQKTKAEWMKWLENRKGVPNAD